MPQALKAEIFATIMDFYATGEAVMTDEPIVTVRVWGFLDSIRFDFSLYKSTH